MTFHWQPVQLLAVPKFIRELHWLPVESRIIFKILLLVYKSLNNLAPAYINSLLKNYKPSHNLRSVDQGLLTVPIKSKDLWGQGIFSCSTKALEFLAP